MVKCAVQMSLHMAHLDAMPPLQEIYACPRIYLIWNPTGDLVSRRLLVLLIW